MYREHVTVRVNTAVASWGTEEEEQVEWFPIAK